MSRITTIVFGPTGGVGSATARTAQEKGAKVILALRDPQKPIPGLSAEQERAAGFERVQADLTQPQTITEAVQKTGAKRAFIYAPLGQTADVRASITALKDAGIEFVVLLSSISVQGDIGSVSPTAFVAFAHAQVEVSLNDVFGSGGYVAVRPAFFASNSFWWREELKEGKAGVLNPEARMDWITPGDIGRVCGSLLVEGPQAPLKDNAVELIGPELVSLKDAIGIIGTELGKDIKITEINKEEGLEWFINQVGMPPPLAAELVTHLSTRPGNAVDENYSGPAYEEAVANVLKFGGRQPTTFSEWVKENKFAFSA